MAAYSCHDPEEDMWFWTESEIRTHQLKVHQRLMQRLQPETGSPQAHPRGPAQRYTRQVVEAPYEDAEDTIEVFD